MTEKQNFPSIVVQYVEEFLEEHFGEKPERVTITVRPPFLLIHLNGFLLPAERLFVEKGRWNSVLETRDIIIHSVKDELLKGLQKHTNWKPMNLYADWNLDKQTGLLMVILEKEYMPETFAWPENVDQEILEEIILLNSIRTQKKPERTNFYWLSDRLLLIERIGILVDIEKQLVQNGAMEELRLAKRPMEQRITELFNLESVLKSEVEDLFVDWDFQQDFSYMVLVLKGHLPEKYRNIETES